MIDFDTNFDIRRVTQQLQREVHRPYGITHRPVGLPNCDPIFSISNDRANDMFIIRDFRNETTHRVHKKDTIKDDWIYTYGLFERGKGFEPQTAYISMDIEKNTNDEIQPLDGEELRRMFRE